MLRNLLYSKSFAFSYYFVISFIIFIIVNFFHQAALHKQKAKLKLQQEIIAEETINKEQLVQEEIVEPPKNTAENEMIKTLTVNPGDTMIDLLQQAGIKRSESLSIIDSLGQVYNLRKINIGTEITVSFEKDKLDANNKIVNKVTINPGGSKKIEVYNFGSEVYQAKLIELPLKKFLIKKSITIDGSFIGSTSKNGIPGNVVLSVIKSLSYDVDFQRDIKKGDSFDIVYEKYYHEDGNFAHYGSVKYANLKRQNSEHKIYKHKTLEGEEEFYDAFGKSVVKSLLRTPINAVRISSGFGVRKHPVLGYSKMHKGVDFAAPVGTPILAAGSGVVEKREVFSGYGNYLRIRHNNVYSTAYAHISKFAQGVKVGSRVKQGQVVAYVGSTGNSTGAHLHYEVLKYGKQINPTAIKLTSVGNKLSGKELKRFQESIRQIDALINIKTDTVETKIE